MCVCVLVSFFSVIFSVSVIFLVLFCCSNLICCCCVCVVFFFTRILGRKKEIFYLMTHSTHFIYGYMASDIW